MIPPRSAKPEEELEPPQRHPEAPAPGSVLSSHYPNCVACGPDHTTGLRLVSTAGEGVTVTGEFLVTLCPLGATPRPPRATAMDEILGTLFWLLRRPMVTGRLETDFIRPVPVGSTLSLRSECRGFAGRRMYATGTGRLGGPDGNIAIKADAVFVIVPAEHSRGSGGRSPEDSSEDVRL